MSNPPPPKLSFAKNHQLIPDDLRELQDNMVNKFQFEKLIPDNLQEIYSEYVGQLEKDYAELYPLIKEFADLTVEDVNSLSQHPSYVVKEYDDPAVSLRVVGRPYDARPGHWLTLVRSVPKTENLVPGQKDPVWMKIGLALWPDHGVAPTPQGTFYCQSILNSNSRIGRSPLFSFMTTKDDTITKSIQIQGDLWTGQVVYLLLELSSEKSRHKGLPDSLKVEFHNGKLSTCQFIEVGAIGNHQLCRITIAESRISGAHPVALIQQYFRDTVDPTTTLPEHPYTIMRENPQMKNMTFAKVIVNNHCREVIVTGEKDYYIEYDGEFDRKTGLYQGVGVLKNNSEIPCTDIGIFDKGMIVKGRKEMEYFIYDGKFQNSKPHGKGSMLMQNGSKYEGDFEDGLQTGIGTLTHKGNSVYRGEMKENSMHGKGCLTLPDGGKFEGLFESDHMVHGSIYFTTSTWTLSDSLSALLQGLFMGPRGFLLSLKVCCRFYFHRVANLFRSRDQKVWAAVYTGHTNSLSQMEGHGKLTDLSGFNYEGDFLAHRPHGFGTATNLFGDKYTGEFREGAYHGRGRLESPLRNEVYEGYFVENMFHGRGTRYQVAKGSVEKTVGVWETGHLSTTEETTQEPYRNQPLSEVGRRPAEDQHTQTKCSDWQQSERPDRLLARQSWQQAPAAAFTARFQMHLWQRWFGSRLHHRRLDSRTFQPASSVIAWGLLPDQVKPRSTFNPVDSIQLLRPQAMGQKPMRLLSRSLFKLCLTKRI